MLQFWFEFASPYSYIAASRIGNLCRDAGVELAWRPFSLAPIFERQGWNTSHYNLNPQRGAYMYRDMERLCEKFGLPWRKPEVFPKNTILALRVAAAFESESWIEQFVQAAFRANFGSDEDLDDRGIIESLLRGCNQDEARVTEALSARRGRLRENTESATERGIFGAPMCIVGDEMFWGEEALEDAIAWELTHK